MILDVKQLTPLQALAQGSPTVQLLSATAKPVAILKSVSAVFSSGDTAVATRWQASKHEDTRSSWQNTGRRPRRNDRGLHRNAPGIEVEETLGYDNDFKSWRCRPRWQESGPGTAAINRLVNCHLSSPFENDPARVQLRSQYAESRDAGHWRVTQDRRRTVT